MDKSLISLTFDDGLDSHLDAAIPILDRYGIKATFFVQVASESLGRRFEEWRRVASAGHEIGNHTVFHPAVGHKDWVSDGNALENYSMDRMRMELETANNVLRMLDGRKERTFAYPCGNTVLGKTGLVRRILERLRLDRTRLAGWAARLPFDPGATLVDYSSLVRKLFVAARCGTLTAETDRKKYPARYRVPSIGCDGMEQAQLLTTVDQAISKGGWTVFSFHGIGGGHGLSTDIEVFAKMIQKISNCNDIRLGTFLDGAKKHFG